MISQLSHVPVKTKHLRDMTSIKRYRNPPTEKPMPVSDWGQMWNSDTPLVPITGAALVAVECDSEASKNNRLLLSDSPDIIFQAGRLGLLRQPMLDGHGQVRLQVHEKHGEDQRRRRPRTSRTSSCHLVT